MPSMQADAASGRRPPAADPKPGMVFLSPYFISVTWITKTDSRFWIGLTPRTTK